MKRIILFAAIAAFLTTNSKAQDYAPVLLNYDALVKKVDKSDEAIAHEKKSLKAATWEKRAKLFQDVDDQGLEQTYITMPTSLFKKTYMEPLQVETEGDANVLVYEHMKYYFENNELRGWKRVNPISEDPLGEALKSYQKAIELTAENKREKFELSIKSELDELGIQFIREGQNKYYFDDFKGALESFEEVLELHKLDVFAGEIDTTMILYSGIVSRALGKESMENGDVAAGADYYKKAIEYYQELADMGYNGASGYLQMTQDYYALGDTVGAIENLKQGLEKYPDSSMLVTFTAQSYYFMRDNEGGLNFIEERLKERPECAIAYYWKGLLITNHTDVEEEAIAEALAYYDTSLMYDPTNAFVVFQSGNVNFALGANYFERAGLEPDADIREEYNATATEYYNAAVEKLEKSYEMAGDDYNLKADCLDILKRIYYKLYGMEDSRYEDVNRRLNEL